ncbi:SusC/RagA family TonB-linked outer membrane protein [Pedobacter sp. LMG 31464]|uniref:SusC/RagA family TonB-linked outer membrane protein n=1 Tax=Pedobacter planticolens TaxID=2679964 RepID=A0A923IU98_9SPHI|nr:SusC/RagA family TonB-linked outer membrane protein [Pedobacter planticolens]MBB2143939.1 SusC/RagA family TonB-linked outer membrane protein [Pedobacter planticolens]
MMEGLRYRAVRFLILCFLLGLTVASFGQIKGRVVDGADGRSLSSAVIKVKGSSFVVMSDSSGRFVVPSESKVLLVSLTGYAPMEQVVAGAELGVLVRLVASIKLLDQVVVNTGYQQLVRERVTGSFVKVDSALLNRSASADLLGRLEGTVPGLVFDRRGVEPEFDRSTTKLRIRGESSINVATEPLVVVDNFPYEGDLTNINPSDVESVTVLKDAAAASIWGAKAGNGVIVITTKKGKYNGPLEISFGSNLIYSPKPDLYYDRGFMPSVDFIEAERAFFAKGFYSALENDLGKSVLSPVVELLFDGKNGRLTSAQVDAAISGLSDNDIRKQANQLLYRGSMLSQSSLSISGGSARSSSILNLGYNNSLASVRGNQSNRLTLNTQHRYRPLEKLELTVGLFLVQARELENGVAFSDLGVGAYPYAQLEDTDGNPLALVRDFRRSYVLQAPALSLLDWQYRPVQERDLLDNTNTTRELRTSFGLKYGPFRGFNVQLDYQFQGQWTDRENLYAKDSYYVRNLVNRYTQADGSMAFPNGAVLDANSSYKSGHSLRGQLNYQQSFGIHSVNLLLGAEGREVVAETNGLKLYGYDPEVLTFADRLDFVTRYPTRPRLTAQLPTNSGAVGSLTDRFLSSYVNGSYSLLERYTLSGSARLDGSNLFGVKANQKSVPLWSAGLAWNMDKEQFLKFPWLDRLKLRASYGFNGNIDNRISAFVTASYANDPLTGQRRASVLNPGNPQLRWEKVQITNLGLDFGFFGRFGGSLEYYVKRGKDLLGNRTIDPTTGLGAAAITNLVNYASTRTNGLDFSLDYRSKGAIRWTASLLLSYAKDIVTEYEEKANVPVITLVTGTVVPPATGRSLNSIYSLPWYGLDPATGDPLVMVGGVLGKDYTGYFQQLKPEQLIYHGRGNPLLTGFVRNGISYGNFSLSATLSFKTGYYFKRDGLNYSTLFSSGAGNVEFASRWKVPGDEQFTSVPAIPASINANRETVYGQSSLMVERGDHIRLQDVNLSYQLKLPSRTKMGLRVMQLYLLGNNLGLLYRANKLGLDPDMPLAIYPLAPTFTIGIKTNLN